MQGQSIHFKNNNHFTSWYSINWHQCNTISYYKMAMMMLFSNKIIETLSHQNLVMLLHTQFCQIRWKNFCIGLYSYTYKQHSNTILDKTIWPQEETVLSLSSMSTLHYLSVQGSTLNMCVEWKCKQYFYFLLRYMQQQQSKNCNKPCNNPTCIETSNTSKYFPTLEQIPNPS